jgi:Flp pilus assembly pilin Flp
MSRRTTNQETMTEYVRIRAAIAAADYTANVNLERGINTIITSPAATLKGAHG